MDSLRIIGLSGLAGFLLGYWLGVPGSAEMPARSTALPQDVAPGMAASAAVEQVPRARNEPAARRADDDTPGRHTRALSSADYAMPGPGRRAAVPSTQPLPEEAGGVDTDTAEAMRVSDEAARQDGLEFSSRDATLDEAQHATRGTTGSAGP